MTKIFTEATAEEFDTYAKNSEYAHFQQTSAWAKLKSKNGWKPYFVVVKDEDKIIAASLLLKKPLTLGRSIFYAPRGPILDYKDKDLLFFFFSNIKKFAKKHHAIFVKIDPEIIHIERNIDGNKVPNGKNNTQIIANLKKLGFKHQGFNIEGNIAPQYTFTLNLEGKNEKEILNDMKNTHRTLLHKNEKNGVIVRKLKYEELDKFSKVMQHTANRRGFTDRPLSYYKEMWNALGDDHIIYISEINLKNYEKILNKEKAEIKKQKEKIERTLAKAEKTRLKRQLKVIIEDENENQKKYERLEKYKKSADKDGVLVLGALMFIKTKNDITSLFGGNYSDYREFNSAYSLNWEMIKTAIKKGYKKYNFYGISEFRNSKDPSYGLYYFKRGFGGQVEEYIGEFDLVISKIWYLAYKIAYILPKTIRREKNNKKFKQAKLNNR